VQTAIDLIKGVSTAPATNVAATAGSSADSAAAIAMNRLGDILVAGGIQPKDNKPAAPEKKKVCLCRHF
jgi:hypothetical protein